MKILNATQIRELDRLSIETEDINSIDLMERAALACTHFLLDNFKTASFYIVAGTGNNGGDGLAIARQLSEKGRKCLVLVAAQSSKASTDFRTNLERLKLHPSVQIKAADELHEIPEVPSEEVLVDAFFGTGLSRPAEGFSAAVINWMNDFNGVRVSVDIPSGMFTEPETENPGPVVQAHHTLSFEMPKRSFLLGAHRNFVGKLHLLDIGLNATAREAMEGADYYFRFWEARKLRKPRNGFSHKGNFGHVLLMAGSTGKFGAAVLSANAALRSGCGLLSCAIPSAGLQILQTALPEAMCLPDPNPNCISSYPDGDWSVIALGPGLGMADQTAEAIRNALSQSTVPVVLDADAINLLALNPDWWTLLKSRAVLTPHPGEMERIGNCGRDELHQYQAAKELARKYDCVIVLKGAHTRIALPNGELWFNSSGNPGMATAGSGDVLTGVIAGLIASGYSPGDAARLGVYLHGAAGDLAAEENSMEALIAGDLIQFLGKTWKSLG